MHFSTISSIQVFHEHNHHLEIENLNIENIAKDFHLRKALSNFMKFYYFFNTFFSSLVILFLNRT